MGAILSVMGQVIGSVLLVGWIVATVLTWSAVSQHRFIASMLKIVLIVTVIVAIITSGNIPSIWLPFLIMHGVTMLSVSNVRALFNKVRSGNSPSKSAPTGFVNTPIPSGFVNAPAPAADLLHDVDHKSLDAQLPEQGSTLSTR